MVKENKPAEEHMSLLPAGADGSRSDDVDTVLTTHGNRSVSHQIGRTDIKLTALQSIQRIETDHGKIPLALSILGQGYTGDDKLGNQPDIMLLVLNNRTAHSSCGSIQFVDGFILSVAAVIHRNTSRRSHPQDATAILHRIIDRRTPERSSVLGTIDVSHLPTMKIKDRNILGMTYQSLMIIEQENGIDEIARYSRIGNIEGREFLCDRIKNLHTTSQSTDKQTMLRVFLEAPDAIISQSAIGNIESLPPAILELGKAAVEGSEIHGSILHGHATHHNIRAKPRLSLTEMPGLSGYRIITHDSHIVGSTPQISCQILRNGTDIAERNGIELAGRW